MPSTKNPAWLTHFCHDPRKMVRYYSVFPSVRGGASRVSVVWIDSHWGLSFHSGLSFGLCKCLIWSMHWSVSPELQPIIRRCPRAHHRQLTIWFHSIGRHRRGRNRAPTRWTGWYWNVWGSGRRLRSLGRMRLLSSRWRMGWAFGHCPCHPWSPHRCSWVNYY